MAYLAPCDFNEALRLLQPGTGKVIAGCTDYYPGLRQGQVDDDLIDITTIPELRGVGRSDRGWRIGATTTWTDILQSPLPAAFDGLKHAARNVGSVQIQNRGTVAGNLCNASPAADGVPPLLALDASVEIASAVGARSVSLADFLIGPRKVDLSSDELLVAIHVPDLPDSATSAFEKLGSRTHMVISIVMVAAVLEVRHGKLADGRVAVGSCSAVAQRLPALEARLQGLAPSDIANMDLGDPELYAPLSPISDVRGSAAYRSEATVEMCRRALIRASRKR